MKRSRHRWMGITLFCVTIILLATELPTTSAVRATSLIFSKTSSTTVAPEELPADEEDGPQTETTAEGADNSTSSKLTGIPQIDYIYDPNLPRELNGYNLSEYPFYESVPPPEMMDFKCDGLHDGFYASVPHKCQVYHHCLYGTRYDFLCANYTAFDQKTFICHFVSEVDCKNSPNYFSRNEALYKATTAAPTPPPPTTTTTTTTTARPTRPPRRRPVYRYDYYDDDYYYRDDYDYGERRKPRPRPGRPGNKNRPVDDYDEDRYERRPRPRDEAVDDDFGERRPLNRRPGKRRPYADDDDRRPYRPGGRRPRPRDEDERYISDEDDRPRGGKRDSIRDDSRPKRPRDEYRPRDERPRDEDLGAENEEIRPKYDARTRVDSRNKDEIKPRDESSRDESKTKDDIRPRDDSRSRDTIRPRDERRPSRDDLTDKPREARPREDRYQNEGRRYRDERPYRNRAERPAKPEKSYDNDDKVEETEDTATAPEVLVKPNGHGLFSQPRMPPKIKRPVPISEKNKYEYVPVATTKPPPIAHEDEYYDYEEYESSRPSSSGKTATVQQRPKPEVVEKEKFKPSRPHSPRSGNRGRKTKKPAEYEEEYYDEPIVKNDRNTNQRNKEERSKPKVNDEYYDYEDKKAQKVTQEKEIEAKEKNTRPNVRVVKRPFLPSRGGSPYLPRGLQPVAGRDVTAPIITTPKPTTTTTTTTTPAPITKRTTTVITEIPASQHLPAAEDEYEYYDEEDIDYDKNKKDTEPQTTAKTTTTVKTTTTRPTTTTTTTAKPETTTSELITPEQKAKHLATKVLRVYNDNYEAIRDKLESTLSPGDYIKPYLATSIPFNQAVTEKYRPKIKAEISKPYTATGKPVIPENISIKQNLADSNEQDYDDRLNEALSPNLPISRQPSGFIPTHRDYTFTRFRPSLPQIDTQFAASEIYQVRSKPHVSIRTPSSFYLQPQRLIYQDELSRQARQVYRLGGFI